MIWVVLKEPHPVFFDTGDSTGTTLFELLPLVDVYLKQYLLRDKNLYQRPQYMNRIWTEYYKSKFDVRDQIPDKPDAPLHPSDADRVTLGWSIALGSFGKWARFEDLIKYYVGVGSFRLTRFVRPDLNRPRDLSVRIKTEYSSESITHQRILVADVARTAGIDISPIRYSEYHKELRESKISVSPFGYGEICLRDFETIVNGAMLLKPDVSHLAMWPNIFVPWQTYAPILWDCSDFYTVLHECLEHGLWKDIAITMQRRYGYYLFEDEGRHQFCQHFTKSIGL